MPRPMLFAEKAVYLSLPRNVRTVRRAAQERLSNPIKTAFEEPDTTTTQRYHIELNFGSYSLV